jgi:hypothetical protein
MCDAIRRIFHLIFGKPQPIEWWLLGADLAIVALIIWLDVPEQLHKRQIAKIVSKITPYMEAGQRIQNELHVLAGTLPQVTGTKQGLAWITEANTWGKTTADSLALHSTQASAAFLLVITTVQAGRTIYSQQYGTFYLSGEVGDCYQTLLGRLVNLQRIMEKPEAYF